MIAILKKTVLVLAAVSLLFSLAACGKEDEGDSKYTTSGTFDPYYNIFKDDVPTGKAISVKGKTFYFDSIEIRTKNFEKLVKSENALSLLYPDVSVEFESEDTVTFRDNANVVFNVPKTKGVREGNVLTIQHTNSEGYTYDVRIEIHETKIIVIHNGHTYDQPGTYSMITFTE